MRKIILFAIVMIFYVCLWLPAVSGAKPNTDIHIYPDLKLIFNGVEDTSGKDGLFDNGTTFLPKAFIYADTAYVPLRYFGMMLGVKEIGWDRERLMIWVDSNKPTDVSANPGRLIETFESYVNTHKAPLHVEPVTISYYPDLRLFFRGKEDTSGSGGMILSGEREVPKALLYKNTTYVPLRYFAAQMDIKNEEIGWDKASLTITVGKGINAV